MISDILKIISDVIPDKDKAAELSAKVQTSYNEALTKGVEADKEIRLAEIQSDSWLQRSWRPIAALIVFFTLFIRFPLYHLIKMYITYNDLPIYLVELEDLPNDFYLMATAFISIYAFGRSQEKRFRK